MTGTNVDTLHSFVELTIAGRIEEAHALLDPEVVVHEADSLPYPGTHHGPAGFKALQEKVFGMFDMKIGETELLDAGDTVIAKMRTTLTSRTSGRTIDMPITEFYSFNEAGRISYVDVYYKDSAAVTELAAE